MQDLNRSINLNDLLAADGKSLDPEYERIVDRLFNKLRTGASRERCL